MVGARSAGGERSSVGIMGLGVIGHDVAAALKRIGFKVAGWSRTPKISAPKLLVWSL